MAPPRRPSPSTREEEAHRYLHALVRVAPVGIAFLDTAYRYRIVNEALAELNGVPRDDHLGRSVEEVLPHLWPRLRPTYDRVLETGEPVTEVDLAVRPDSASVGRRWLANYYPVSASHGKVVGIGVVITEVTERVRAEDAARRLEEREREALEGAQTREESLRAVLAALPELVFTLDRDGRHLSFHAPNREALFVDPEGFLGNRVRDVLPAEVADRYEAAIELSFETGAVQVFGYTLDFDDQDRRVYDARMVRKADDEVLVIVRDVTEVKALEAKFRQAQKMDAMGRLAGGVAHDFNNLLTVINGNCDLLLSGAGHDEDHEALISEVRDAGRRASALTRQLLLFTRQQMVEPRVLSLNGVVSKAEAMLGRLIGEDVLLTTELAPDAPAIVADAGQIEQVLVNLSVNARDAMPEGGRLTIRTAHERAARRTGSPEPRGEVVVLSVSDSGTGIDEGVRDRMFEPFFTTKPPGEGSGLGLSVVFGVVEDSGGTIDVESEPERGTTIHLRFPAVAQAAEEEVTGRRADMPRGTETVLLVEDDAPVRAVAHRCLTLCGYRILEARDGAEALEVARSFEERIHLLITDVVMPHLGGVELAGRLQADRPETVVLFVSGHSDDEGLREGVFGSDLAFLQKPFSPSALATRVRKLLDGGRDEGG